jgi:hypothetical protein
MKQTNYFNFLSTLLAVLGIILFFYSQILGTLLIVLALVCAGLWFVTQHLEKIEQKIEMLNNHTIKNDERLHNIEQIIKKMDGDEAP